MKSTRALLALSLTLLILPALSWADEASFDSDGVPIHYRTDGEGEPVVLIHGFTANAALNWIGSGVYGALAKDYRVIALDARGHGKSGKPHGAEHYGAKMAKDVINLLDELGIPRAHVIGYSMGGFITTNIVCNYPERVISAVSGGAGWTSPGEFEAGDINALAESLENGNGFGPLMEALNPVGQPGPSKEDMDAMNRALLAMNDPLALASVARGLGGLAVTEDQLRANTIPVKAIIGGIDPLKAGVDTMAEVMSNLEVQVLDGADHMNAFGRADFIEGIQRHLTENGLEKRTDADSGARVAAAGASR